MSIKKYLALAAMCAVMGMAGETAFNGVPKDKSPKPHNPNSYSLPCWSFDGKKVFARNEKEAIKRAKKRGYWREGVTIIKL